MQTTGRWRYGLFLSLVTAVIWGLLPLGLKGILLAMDPVTVTWYRFVVAGVFVGAYLAINNRLPDLRKLRGPVLGLAAICIISLCLNYNFYVLGLATISPSTAQVTIQFAPMLLLFGGIVIFRESFSAPQWLGVFTFAIGIVLFFNLRLEELFTSITDYTMGVIWILLAALTWAFYALSQKELLKAFPSASIMLLIYVVGSLLMLPFTKPAQIADLNGMQWLLLIFCCFNAIVGYGAFAEALNHWEASRISAVLALQPLVTLGFNQVLCRALPEYWPAEQVNGLAVFGAFLVVIGSAATALWRRQQRAGAQ